MSKLNITISKNQSISLSIDSGKYAHRKFGLPVYLLNRLAAFALLTLFPILLVVLPQAETVFYIFTAVAFVGIVAGSYLDKDYFAELAGLWQLMVFAILTMLIVLVNGKALSVFAGTVTYNSLGFTVMSAVIVFFFLAKEFQVEDRRAKRTIKIIAFSSIVLALLITFDINRFQQLLPFVLVCIPFAVDALLATKPKTRALGAVWLAIILVCLIQNYLAARTVWTMLIFGGIGFAYYAYRVVYRAGKSFDKSVLLNLLAFGLTTLIGLVWFIVNRATVAVLIQKNFDYYAKSFSNAGIKELLVGGATSTRSWVDYPALARLLGEVGLAGTLLFATIIGFALYRLYKRKPIVQSSDIFVLIFSIGFCVQFFVTLVPLQLFLCWIYIYTIINMRNGGEQQK